MCTNRRGGVSVPVGMSIVWLRTAHGFLTCQTVEILHEKKTKMSDTVIAKQGCTDSSF